MTQCAPQNGRTVELDYSRVSIERRTARKRRETVIEYQGEKKERKMPYCEWVRPAILLETASILLFCLIVFSEQPECLSLGNSKFNLGPLFSLLQIHNP